jgi:hypothetical protein
MKRNILLAGVLTILCSVGALATTVYSNTTTDTFDTVFFSAGPYSGLGDQVLLAPGDRLATDATVQFFNNGLTGTFDAILRLYQVGSPVGAQIGTDFITTGISASNLGVFNVVFNTAGTLVPDALVFMVFLTNVSGGVDVGLNMFEPPTIGSSNNTFLVANTGSFAQLSTPNENVFFELNASVPEPGAFGTVGGGMIAVFLAFRRRSGRPASRTARESAH